MKPSGVFGFVVGLMATILPVSNARAQVSFPGPELLGRPTASSVTINVVASTAVQAYVEYGPQAGGPYTHTSPAAGASGPASAAANVPLVLLLSGLSPDTQYFYRMVYRQTSTSSWVTRAEHSFHTQRLPGSSFAFTVAADSHINIVFGNASLYQQTLQNIAGEKPDFHLDLGDTFAMDSVTTQAQANSSYLNLRSYFGLISPSVPLFLVLGNHEQEEGWHLNDTGNLATSPPVMSTNARNQYYLNPDPLLDSFYTGNTDVSTSAISGNHAIRDYYAWQWGDALFVVIDPYWYTTTKPYVGNEGGGEGSDPGSGDRWDWTLGWPQYQWLEQTLENSDAQYKFIFAHQVTGGIDDYGRGGAKAVPYNEWGGYDDDGTTWDFGNRRSGWDAPIHQLLVKYNVTAFFHAHDHEFAYEKRDGVVYQLVPMAADATYGYGFAEYHATDPYTISVLPNSGHLRVTVSSAQVTVDYVRAFLSGAGTNGQIAYTYSIPAPGTQGSVAVSSLTLNPSSVLGGATSTATVTLNGPAPSDMAVTLASSNPSAATVPPTVTVPANSTSATFSVASQTVASPATSVITATLNGSAQATLTVYPAATAVASLTLNPATVVGGSANATGTVTLNGFAPLAGVVVTLSSSKPSAATVPASVTVPSNANSATFKITSLAVTAAASVVITATFNSGSKTATLTVNPPTSFTPVRINSGGPAYTDSLGQRWTADSGYSGGSPYTVSKTIASTLDPTLYKTSRYGTSFSYSVNAPSGKYLVTLKFAELYWTAAGGRVFNVAINGSPVLSNFDIYKSAGAAYKAVDVTTTVTSTGKITIQFTTGSAGNPLVNAIQVVASP